MRELIEHTLVFAPVIALLPLEPQRCSWRLLVDGNVHGLCGLISMRSTSQYMKYQCQWTYKLGKPSAFVGSG